MSEAPLLRAQDLRVERGGVQVLDVPALELESGSVLALIGPNGSGKTTLLKTLASLQEPWSGSLAFRGEALGSRPDGYRRKVTMVFQAPLLFDATVRANLESGLRLHGIPARERAARVQDVARRFGVAPLLERSARKLSGGEAQRTCLARAFALHPEILFLDEPFASLDPPTREGLLEDLAGALRETRTTAVLATHDLMEALRLADRMAVMNHGRIVQAGRPQEVVQMPADTFVARFVGMKNLLEGRIAVAGHGRLLIDLGGPRVAAAGHGDLGERVFVGIRPENVTLAPDGAFANHLAGTVVRIIPKSHYLKVEVDCGFPLAAHVLPDALADLGLEPGRPVTAGFRDTAVQVLRS